MASESQELTYPHEYAALLNDSHDAGPVIVGGQAVNLWALTYLPQADHATFGSIDLDILATPKVVNWMATVPGWTFQKDDDENAVRKARITTKTNAGKRLQIEALNFVLGLNEDDLKAVVELSYQGKRFKLLDPIALLKAKCVNMDKLRQGGLERHDEMHVKILGQCVPAYLRALVAEAIAGHVAASDVTRALGRLFDVMQTPALAGILWSVGLTADSLVPDECQNSPVKKISEACEARMPACRKAIKMENYTPKHKTVQTVRLPSGRKPRTPRHY